MVELEAAECRKRMAKVFLYGDFAARVRQYTRHSKYFLGSR